MNASSDRQRDLRALKDLARATSVGSATATRPRAAVTMSADSSGYVDLDALGLSGDRWVDDALRRAPAPAPRRGAPSRAAAPSTTNFTAVASVPSGASVVARDIEAPLPEDADDAPDSSAFLPRARRLGWIVAVVSTLCAVLCGVAVRQVFAKRDADAEAARTAAVSQAMPPVERDIPAPPPATEVAAPAPASVPPHGAQLDTPVESAASENTTSAAPVAKRAARPSPSRKPAKAKAKAAASRPSRAPVPAKAAGATPPVDPFEAAMRRSFEPTAKPAPGAKAAKPRK